MKYAIILSLALLGCSSMDYTDFDKGATDQELFERDAAACEMEAKNYKAKVGGKLYNLNAYYNEMMETCMRSKGYRAK